MYPKLINGIVNNRDRTSLCHKLRKERFLMFLEKLGVSSEDSILDVGGHPNTWIDTGLETNVTLLNVTKPNVAYQKRGFKYIQGNALNMHMFENHRFDIVFSNSVIEHVGSIQNQRKFADEVRRVGKSYWIQTPNKMFPIEPHFLFPFFQFLPDGLQSKIAKTWKYSHFKQWDMSVNDILNELSDIRLLSRNEMITLFESAHLYEEKYFFLTKSFVMYQNSKRKSKSNLNPRISWVA